MRPLNISGSQAKDYYYEKDPFFTNNEKLEQSKWHGLIADEWGIKNETVLKKDFINIIAGNDLNGNQLIKTGKDKDGNQAHRAAIDIPFSAPKSVSLCALHLGDSNLISAHQKAIEKTVDYIENKYTYVRHKTDKTRPVITKNGLVATFNHSTSRANDPQLHSHTLLMNMSYSHLAEDYRATWNDYIFDHQKHLTMVYQSELSKLVKDLGYEVEKRPNGFWEIAGVKQEWIDKFSKRKKQIDEKEEELKDKIKTDNESLLRNAAVLDSRDGKNTTITKEELLDLWEKEVPREKIQKSLDVVKTHKIEKSKNTPDHYIRLAYKSINENESTFKKNDVIDTALSLSMGEYLTSDYEVVYDQFIKNGELIHIDEIENDRGLIRDIYTSEQILSTEMEIVKQFDRGVKTSKKHVSKKVADSYINSKYSYFTEGQKQALKTTLTTTDKFIIIQGDAGTGKTSMMKSFKDITDKECENLNICGLGFTGKAADELEKKSGIKTKTISGFLINPDQEKSLFIVDESSMVGSYQMLNLMNHAEKTDSRIVFIGDGKQLQAISAGKMFKVLSQNDYTKAVLMEESIRQKTEYMIETVSHIKNYQTDIDKDGMDKAFKVLKDNNRIFEIEDKDERINHVIDSYISEKAFEKNIIVTPKNSDRKIINELIIGKLEKRNLLKESSIEDKKEMISDVRLPVSIIGEAKLHASSYIKGNKAFINQKNISSVINAGEVLNVQSIEDDKINISYNNNEYSFKINKLEKQISAYEKLDIEAIKTAETFKTNDNIFLRTPTINEAVYKVKTVDLENNSITIKRNKMEHTLDLNLAGNALNIYKSTSGIQPDNINNSIFISEENIITDFTFKTGQELEILDSNLINNTIDVKQNNLLHTIDMHESGTKISVYEEEKRTFSLGEKIVFLKNDKKLEIQNGLTAIIDDIDTHGNVRAKVDDDRSVYFNLTNYQYVDHGYAVTVHKSQGQDSEKVYIFTDTEYKGLNNTEIFNVGITRGEHDASLYIDNTEVFKSQVKNEQDKTSSLDHVKFSATKNKVTSKEMGKEV